MTEENKSNKKIFFLAIIVLFITVIIIYRQRIFSIKTDQKNAASTTEDKKTPIETNETKQINNVPPLINNPSSKKATQPTPAYAGRDPQEIKPADDIVKTLDANQKDDMYYQIKVLGQTVKENPQYVSGWLQIGLLKKAIGDYVGTRDAWEYAALVRPYDPVPFKDLGELYWHYLPDLPRAEKNLQIAIKDKPDDTSTYISLSELYSSAYKEKQSLALDILLQGVNANKDDNDIVKSVADYYQNHGMYEQSLEWWQKALQKEPSNQSIIQTIADLKNKLSK